MASRYDGSPLITNYFISNEYYFEYLKLIEEARSEIPQGYTESHHIVPKYYFTKNNLEIDNSSNNLVILSFSKHIYAHYLLSLCTKGDYKRANTRAYKYMLKKRGLRCHKLSLTTIRELQEDEKLYTKLEFKKLEDLYINKRLSYDEIAKLLDCSASAVVKNIQKYNLQRNRVDRKISNYEEFYNYYIVENHSRVETAKHFGVGEMTITTYCRNHNINKFKLINEAIKISYDDLKKCYIDNNMTAKNIAKLFKTSYTNVLRHLNKYQIYKGNFRKENIYA